MRTLLIYIKIIFGKKYKERKNFVIQIKLELFLAHQILN